MYIKEGWRQLFTSFFNKISAGSGATTLAHK